MHIESTFRTVSAPAVLVIAGTIPVGLELTVERLEVNKEKSTGNRITGRFRENTVSKWQRRWNDKDRGRWTARLIPDIKPWISRTFGDLNCYHAYFRKIFYSEWARPPALIVFTRKRK